MPIVIVLALAALTLSTPALPQSSTAVSGVVLSDSLRRPIADVRVSLVSPNRIASTDAEGRFSFTNVPAGTHELTARRLGYLPYREVISVKAGAVVQREILLVAAVRLDSVVITSSSPIPSFEEHRAIGLGAFIARDQLERQADRRLSDVLAQIRGVKIIPGRSGNAWLANPRGVRSLNPKTCGVSDDRLGNNRGLDRQDVAMGAKQCECYAQVYLDRAMVYRGSQVAGEPLFNVNSIPIDQIEAIEYYASPAQTPMLYSKLNSPCGVLVIHTRVTR